MGSRKVGGRWIGGAPRWWWVGVGSAGAVVGGWVIVVWFWLCCLGGLWVSG